jgi:hypothetical protein
MNPAWLGDAPAFPTRTVERSVLQIEKMQVMDGYGWLWYHLLAIGVDVDGHSWDDDVLALKI